MTMARALGNPNADDTHPFWREEGLQVCLRLRGFDLVHIVQRRYPRGPDLKLTCETDDERRDATETDRRACGELERLFRSGWCLVTYGDRATDRKSVNYLATPPLVTIETFSPWRQR